MQSRNAKKYSFYRIFSSFATSCVKKKERYFREIFCRETPAFFPMFSSWLLRCSMIKSTTCAAGKNDVFQRNIHFKSHSREYGWIRPPRWRRTHFIPPASEWTQSGNSFLPFTLNTRPPFTHLRQTRRLVSSLMTGPTLFHRVPFPRWHDGIIVLPTNTRCNWTVVETDVRRTFNWRAVN